MRGARIAGSAVLILVSLGDVAGAAAQIQLRFVHRAILQQAPGAKKQEIRVAASLFNPSGPEWVCKESVCTLLQQAPGAKNQEIRVAASLFNPSGPEWVCKESVCTLELSTELDAASLCWQLRRKTGEIRSYSYRPLAKKTPTEFTAKELATCNGPLTTALGPNVAALRLPRTPTVSGPWYEAKAALLRAGYRFVDVQPYFVCSDLSDQVGLVREQQPRPGEPIVTPTAVIRITVVDDDLPLLLTREHGFADDFTRYVESLGLTAEVEIDWGYSEFVENQEGYAILRGLGAILRVHAWTDCIGELQRFNSSVKVYLYRPRDRMQVPRGIIGARCDRAVRSLLHRRLSPVMRARATDDRDLYGKITSFSHADREGEIIPTLDTSRPLVPIPARYADGPHETVMISYGVPRDFLERLRGSAQPGGRDDVSREFRQPLTGPNPCGRLEYGRRLYGGW